MSLTSQDIDRIAQLARLDLSAGERAALLGQLNGFFDLAQRLQAVDTQGVQPLTHPVDALPGATAQALRLRDDVVTETNRREAHQQSAPAVERGLFLVPRVVE